MLTNDKQVKTIFEIDHSGELFRKLLDIFETDIPLYILDLEKALKAEQFEIAKKLSHSIKSSSLNMGATELANVAGSFETSAELNSGHDPGLILEFQTCYQKTVTELRGYLNLCKPNGA